jgi:putative membrane protein
MGVMDLAQYEKLHLTTTSSFDAAYTKAQFEAHERVVTLLRGYGHSRQTAPPKAFAQKALPALEHHLEMIKGLYPKIGSAG